MAPFKNQVIITVDDNSVYNKNTKNPIRNYYMVEKQFTAFQWLNRIGGKNIMKENSIQ